MAIAGIVNWGLSKPQFLLVSITAVMILCIVAILFCSLWIKQIRDFKSLNNAKFEVLNKMAPLVSFGLPSSDPRVSYSPFEREWELLKKAEAVQEISSIKLMALKSSNIEYLIPRTFRVIFLAILIVVVIVIVRNWRTVFDSSLLILQRTQ